MGGAQDKEVSRYIIDAEWMNIWVHFIQGGYYLPPFTVR